MTTNNPTNQRSKTLGTVTPVRLNGAAYTNAEIAAHLREQAELIEADEFGEVRNVFVVIEPMDGGLVRQTCGRPCDVARAVGILTAAAIRAIV